MIFAVGFRSLGISNLARGFKVTCIIVRGSPAHPRNILSSNREHFKCQEKKPREQTVNMYNLWLNLQMSSAKLSQNKA